MFENLMQVEHPNIVKFHKYWLDMKESQARVRLFILSGLSSSPLSHTCVINSFPSSVCGPQVIFITEYMSSGSLKQFLKKTKKNHKTMNVKVSGRILYWCAHSVCPVVVAPGTAVQSLFRSIFPARL